ncbi:MAG: leucine-rich repeat domain-containing protein, partial [Clostridia bacterium]|nr:leucine-rich repeat domain-containing protein [Clostridia bacterium]
GGTSIADSAFYNCANIETISLPAVLTTIADNAFYGCTGIEKVYITDMTAWLAVEFGNEYSNPLCYGAQLYLNDASVEHIVISKDVLAISDNQFKNNTQIKTVTFEEGSLCTSIGNYAFLGCTNLESITLPSNITSIGTEAFRDCKKLNGINLPNGLLTIGANAFDKCQALTTIVVPNSVTSIGSGAFDYCTALTNITIPFVGGGTSEYTNFGYIFGSSAYNAQNSVIPSTLKTVTVTGGTFISMKAFYGCENIETIVLPEGLSTIGANAFERCYSLKQINIPSSLTMILEDVFNGCNLTRIDVADIATWCNIDFTNGNSTPVTHATKLYVNGVEVTEIVIPQNITEIKNYTFQDLTQLTKVTFASDSRCASIGESAFYGCSNLASITLPSSLTRIKDYAFGNCSKLTNIVVPDSVTSIGSAAFNFCNALESITLPFTGDGTTSNTYLGYIFGASNPDDQNDIIPSTLKTVTITGGTSIAEYAFYGCDSIETIILPEGITTIGSEAFVGCSGLKTINIPSTVTRIAHYAFSCENLVRVDITDIAAWCNISFADGMTNPLNYNAKLYLNGVLVENLVIPSSVTAISNYAFFGAIQLKTLSFESGASGVVIGEAAFEYSGITSVDLTGVSSILDIAFAYTALTEVVVPNSVTNISFRAFEWCSMLESIILPFVGDGSSYTHLGYIFGVYSGEENAIAVPSSLKTVTITGGDYIDDFAFYGCENIETIVLPEGLTTIGVSAFAYSDYLKTINIPSTVTRIGEGTFADCTSLERVDITDIAAWCNIVFDDMYSNPLFYGAKLYLNGVVVENLIIPKEVVIINSDAFIGYNALKSVSFETGSLCTTIESEAFAFSNVETISLPNSLVSIGDYAFYNCDFTSIIVPNSVTSIGLGAFEGCESLISITLPFTG